MALLLSVERRDQPATSPTLLLRVQSEQNIAGGLLPAERTLLRHGAESCININSEPPWKPIISNSLNN
jgi:hypothetical protein